MSDKNLIYMVHTTTDEGTFALQGIFEEKGLADELCNLLLKAGYLATVDTEELMYDLPTVFTHVTTVNCLTGDIVDTEKTDPVVSGLRLYLNRQHLVVRGTSKEDAKKSAEHFWKLLKDSVNEIL